MIKVQQVSQVTGDRALKRAAVHGSATGRPAGELFFGASRFALQLLVILTLSSGLIAGQSPEALSVESRIPLPHVKGRIDHFSVDINAQRLFVAAVENHTLEVVDLKTGQVVHTIADLAEPQGATTTPPPIIYSSPADSMASPKSWMGPRFRPLQW